MFESSGLLVTLMTRAAPEFFVGMSCFRSFPSTWMVPIVWHLESGRHFDSSGTSSRRASFGGT